VHQASASNAAFRNDEACLGATFCGMNPNAIATTPKVKANVQSTSAHAMALDFLLTIFSHANTSQDQVLSAVARKRIVDHS
jgi:hypothetical protein